MSRPQLLLVKMLQNRNCWLKINIFGGYRNQVKFHIAFKILLPHSYGASQPVPHSYGASQPVPHSYGASQPVPHSYVASQPVPHSYGARAPPHSPSPLRSTKPSRPGLSSLGGEKLWFFFSKFFTTQTINNPANLPIKQDECVASQTRSGYGNWCKPIRDNKSLRFWNRLLLRCRFFVGWEPMGDGSWEELAAHPLRRGSHL